MNQRVLYLARRLLGRDVEAAATGVLRPIPFAGPAAVVLLLALVLLAGETRSLWALALLGVALAAIGVVVRRGRNQRVLLAVRGGYLEVHRWRFPYRSVALLWRLPYGDLRVYDKGRSLLLYLAPGGLMEVEGQVVALNHSLQ